MNKSPKFSSEVRERAVRMVQEHMVVRLLDEKDTSVTLATLARASAALGTSLRFELGTAVAA
ncbi:MAG: hypothetical protein Q8S02_03485 [Hydrogenophaga sp.]|nr:hypothetical protein [Hydrogenophaga sp.]